MSLEYVIDCDGCGRVIDGSTESAAKARESVRRDGGKTGLPGGKDLCWDCAREGKAPE